jgi:hypothetical protein
MGHYSGAATSGRETTGSTAYRTFVDEVRRGGNFHIVPRRLACALGIISANLLMHLCCVAQSNATSGGWVLATPAFIENGLGLSAERQTRVLARLEERGLVEISQRGERRYIRIDLARVRRLLGGGQ